MKRLNKNGFTLIELLAVVVLLGILTGAALAAYSSYRGTSADKAFDMMSESAYNAAEEYYMDHFYELKAGSNITIKKLVCNNYLERTKDPYDKKAECYGTVKVSSIAKSNDKLDDSRYVVHIVCSGHRESCKKYPGGNDVSECSGFSGESDQLSSSKGIIDCGS